MEDLLGADAHAVLVVGRPVRDLVLELVVEGPEQFPHEGLHDHIACSECTSESARKVKLS